MMIINRQQPESDVVLKHLPASSEEVAWHALNRDHDRYERLKIIKIKRNE